MPVVLHDATTGGLLGNKMRRVRLLWAGWDLRKQRGVELQRGAEKGVSTPGSKGEGIPVRPCLARGGRRPRHDVRRCVDPWVSVAWWMWRSSLSREEGSRKQLKMADPGLAQGRLVRGGKTHGMVGPVPSSSPTDTHCRASSSCDGISSYHPQRPRLDTERSPSKPGNRPRR